MYYSENIECFQKLMTIPRIHVLQIYISSKLNGSLKISLGILTMFIIRFEKFR